MVSSISIVIPVFNMGKTIEKCVESIVEHSKMEIEIIIVDDGSQDDTPLICDRLSEKYDNIHVFHKANEGSGPARNYGIKKASGRYVYFPDADDMLEPNAINVMQKVIEDSECDLLVFGFISKTESGKTVSIKKYPDMTLSGDKIRNDYSEYIGYEVKYPIQGAPWNKLFKLDVIKKNNIEFPPLRRHQDEAFIARYMCHTNRVRFIKDVLYVHFVNDLRREWDKYPIEYIQSVLGLRQDRIKTILQWNPKDKETKAWMDCEFVCGVIKACELTFSPKAKLSCNQRKHRIIEYIDNNGVIKYSNNSKIGKYQRIVLRLSKHRFFPLVLITMWMKIHAEKLGLSRALRRR